MQLINMRNFNLCACSTGSLTSGQTFQCNDISEILAYEENIKHSCGVFNDYLEVMKSFGGEEVFDF